MKKIIISIVIPNYNGEHLLKKNFSFVLKALQEYDKTGGEGEIIIVDDRSTDESILFIQSLVKTYKIEIRLIESKRNYGFSSTVNTGVSAAKGDIVVLLNSDVVPEKDFIPPLIKHFSNQSVFAVGCMDKSIEDGKIILRGRGVGSWKRGFLIHRKGEVDKTDTLWVSCGSGAFKKDIWDKLGGLDTLFNPFYWEDIDLSYRSLKAGYSLIFEPKSIVIHNHEEGIIKNRFTPSTIRTTAYRNQLIFTWKNMTDASLIFSHLCWLPYHVLSAFARGDKAFLKGFFLALFLLPKIIQLRFVNKKIFIKSDKEVTKYL